MMRFPMTAALISILTTASLIVAGRPATACDEYEEAAEPSLNRAVAARVVEGREPFETAGPFEANGERLYIFLDIDNPTTSEVVYTVNWHHLDLDRRFSQTIEAGHSPRWRTWVFHRMSERRVGNWHVEVVAPSGEVQAELDFTVVPESGAEPAPSEPPVPSTPDA